MSEKVRYRWLGFMGFSLYRVGTDGSLWTWRMNRKKKYRWKKLKSTSNTGGPNPYKKATLVNGFGKIKQKEMLLHRLVLFAFVGPCPHPTWEACHNDGVRFNNNLSNLRWDSRESNQADRTKHGTSNKGKSINKGESNPCAVLTEAKVRRMRQMRRDGKTYNELAEYFGVSHWTVGEIIRGHLWK